MPSCGEVIYEEYEVKSKSVRKVCQNRIEFISDSLCESVERLDFTGSAKNVNLCA